MKVVTVKCFCDVGKCVSKRLRLNNNNTRVPVNYSSKGRKLPGNNVTGPVYAPMCNSMPLSMWDSDQDASTRVQLGSGKGAL